MEFIKFSFLSFIISTCFLITNCESYFNQVVNWVDNKFKCQLHDCCNEFDFREKDLQNELSRELHGQHLVISQVMAAVGGHLKNPNPRKALVLSFHGWTGSGKNFVSKIIARNLFKSGYKSGNILYFISTSDFPHNSKMIEYKDLIRNKIIKQTKKCSRSLFVFDEIDKMPIGLIETLSPFLDIHNNIDQVDYRKSIFILLSNTAGNYINKAVYQHWLDSKPRESMTSKYLESFIIKSAFNEVEGGLWHTSLIKNELISAFIPFLPMERHHIKLCIRDEFLLRNFPFDENLVNKVADQLHYFPEDIQLYSTSGCKRVSQKVDMAVYTLHQYKTEL